MYRAASTILPENPAKPLNILKIIFFRFLKCRENIRFLVERAVQKIAIPSWHAGFWAAARGLKHPSLAIALSSMGNDEKSSQRDKDLAAEERPVPSQAEGDLETVEEDLEDKSKKGEAGKK